MAPLGRIPIEARKPPQWTWYLPVDMDGRNFANLLEIRRALRDERDTLMKLPEPNLPAAMGGPRAEYRPIYRVSVAEADGSLTYYLCMTVRVDTGVLTLTRSVLEGKRAPNGLELNFMPDRTPRTRHLWPDGGTTVLIDELNPSAAE